MSKIQSPKPQTGITRGLFYLSRSISTFARVFGHFRGLRALPGKVESVLREILESNLHPLFHRIL